VNPSCATEQQQYLCSTNDKGGTGTSPSSTMPKPHTPPSATHPQASPSAGE
jgi:hypothetical protein